MKINRGVEIRTKRERVMRINRWKRNENKKGSRKRIKRLDSYEKKK